MFFVAKIEAVAVTGVFQWCRAIDEKHGANETRCVSFANQKPRVLVTSSLRPPSG
jgi:hypothetical protein